MSDAGSRQSAYGRQLNRVYLGYVACFALFVLLLAGLERLGLSREAIGLTFLLATVGLYAAIGIVSRTTDPAEYYVAGRRVPAIYNGMATAADWMSAASFIGLAGTLYLQGFNGLALRAGLDRRLLPGQPCCWRPTCAASAASRFPTSSAGTLRRPLAAPARGVRLAAVLLHLRGGPALRRRRSHRLLPDRDRLRARRLPGPGRHADLLLPGRHARG